MRTILIVQRIMKIISNETQKLAALAVFGALYDAKKDIYSVLCEFIKQIFVIKGLHSIFSVEGLREELVSQFGFDNIPLSVVRTTINKMNELNLNQETHLISVADNDLKKYQTISVEFQKEELYSEALIKSLFAFFEKHTNEILSEETKLQIQHALYSYILKEEYKSQYAELINLFILEHENDNDFIAQLQQMVTGVLILAALKFQSHPNQIDKFNNTLYIYLDTEIIFFLAGYNGVLYQTLAQECLEQIQKMNEETKKCHKEDKIKLRFFEEVDQEITDFFNLAIKIVDNEVPLDRTKRAMQNLISGCTSASDVIAKKSELNLLLKKYNIKIDNKINYYAQDKYKYNIENRAFYENISDPIEEKKVDAALHLLSHINVRRGDRSQKIFNNVGCILLTGDSTTINISLDDKVLRKGDVPLATTMSYLTNRFWFTTNHSFANNPNIQSFKIATRARLALSAEMTLKIQTHFQKLQQDYKNGNISDEMIGEQLSELQQYSMAPENLDDKHEAISDYYAFLRVTNVEQLIEEKVIEKKKSNARITEQSDTILQQENMIDQQNSIIEKQAITIDTQTKQIADKEESIKNSEQMISAQKARIRYLEERPLRVILHLLLCLRFVLMWCLLFGTIIIVVYTVIDFYANYEKNPFYANLSSICSIICFIITLFTILFKKTRAWFSCNSFKTNNVEAILDKTRDRRIRKKSRLKKSNIF